MFSIFKLLTAQGHEEEHMKYTTSYLEFSFILVNISGHQLVVHSHIQVKLNCEKSNGIIFGMSTLSLGYQDIL